MICLFNRKELLITQSLEKRNNVCALLTQEQIPYTTRTRTGSLTQPDRYRGVPFISPDTTYEYRIYVHRKDYERAAFCLRRSD